MIRWKNGKAPGMCGVVTVIRPRLPFSEEHGRCEETTCTNVGIRAYLQPVGVEKRQPDAKNDLGGCPRARGKTGQIGPIYRELGCLLAISSWLWSDWEED